MTICLLLWDELLGEDWMDRRHHDLLPAGTLLYDTFVVLHPHSKLFRLVLPAFNVVLTVIAGKLMFHHLQTL